MKHKQGGYLRAQLPENESMKATATMLCLCCADLRYDWVGVV